MAASLDVRTEIVSKVPPAVSTFFGEHSEYWLGRSGDYPEAGPQRL